MSIVFVIVLICSLCPISTFAYGFNPPAQQTRTYDVEVGQSITIPSQGYGGEWKSSDTSVATVNSFGYVTGVSEGTAKITRTVYNYYFFFIRSSISTTEYTVKVYKTAVPEPEPEPIEDDSTHIKVGESITLNAGFHYWTTWLSSDRNVAEVTNNGTVTGKSVGTATIRASYMIGWFTFFGFGQMSSTEFKITVDPSDAPVPPETVYHTVKFNSNGGTVIQEQKIQDGEKATKPDNPEKEGSDFKGWFTDNGTFAIEYDFDTLVTADIELFAKWAEENESQVILSGFAADDTYFIADSDSVITFTVDVSDNTKTVTLCNDSEGVLGEMNDDGVYGDAVADDGVFTFTLDANYPQGAIEFYAKSGDSLSNIETIQFFSRPSEELRDIAQGIQQQLNDINSKYANEEGTIPPSSVDTAISEAIEYAQKLIDEGKISDYEVTETSVVYKLTSGLTLLFSPRIEGTYSGAADNSLTIYTFQPLYNWVSGLNASYISLPSGVNNEADLIPAAARSIANEFDNCSYSSATATKNQNIAFSDIKGIGSNQIVLWQGHGDWAGSKIHSVLLTNGEFDWDAWFWNPIYFIDCCANRIVNQNGWESVSSKYIDRYCGNMNNTYIYLGPCESGHDSVLAQAFLNKGASAVIGNTRSVLCLYGDMMEYSTTKLLTETNPDTGNYYTLGEALSKAKALYGTNDSRYGGYGAEPTIFGGDTARNYHLADIPAGTLSGKICKASDRITPVIDATINVYKDSILTQTKTADSNGNYSIRLPEGQYYIKIEAEGYVDFGSYATVTKGQDTYMETFLLIQGSEGEVGMASGKVTNSITGSGAEGVTLTVHKDWNNDKEDADTLDTTTTSSNGKYSLELPLGNYTVIASKEGYLTSTFNIIVQSGTTDNQNGIITPVGNGDEYLITLTWGENPRDLDSHVVGGLSNNSNFHVYYSHMNQYDGEIKVCSLDYDDTTSYGPEHITLIPTTDEPYYYYVYRYAGSGTVASSEAKITVHRGNELIATYNVPTNLGSGDYWNVFAIEDGQIITKNTITSSADTSYAN